MEEIANTRIITIAKYGFVFEVLLVMPKLPLNVGKHCVKLIILLTLRLL